MYIEGFYDILKIENACRVGDRMKKIVFMFILVLFLVLSSCTRPEQEEEIIIEDDGTVFTQTAQEKIPVTHINIPHSTTKGNLDNFINYWKPIDINPIFFETSLIKTHQLILIFDAIYPIDMMVFTSYVGDRAETIPTISIDTSLNLYNYSRYQTNYELSEVTNTINFGGTMAKSVRITFAADDQVKGIQDIHFKLSPGIIVQEDDAWSKTFLRYEGWTGADGIFSFNLTNGDTRIGAEKDQVGFIFSDTFVGKVYPHNHLRQSGIIINNSLGYMNQHLPFDQAFTFDYNMADITPKSIFEPTPYIGSRPRNLLDNEGLSITRSKNALLTNQKEGTMWLSDEIETELTIDLMSTHQLGSLNIWNYNANPNYGVKKFELSSSLDKTTWTTIDTFDIEKALGSAQEPYTIEISFNQVDARYLKLIVLESYSQSYTGLGKIMIFDEQDNFLFGEIEGSYETSIEPNENSARLWLQDGIVLNDTFYVFPILIKDDGEIFKVHNVSMIKMPIVDEKFDHQNATYLNAPLMVKTSDSGVMYFGAGLMNNTHIDGYIYIYGYKDLDGRKLVVGRFLPEDIENFNQWTYFDGENWTSLIENAKTLKDGVSPELSVTYIESGKFAGKYMLVIMENSTSGRISYALSDTPYGQFGDYVQIYQTTESQTLRGGFTYNAKMHPVLSEPGNYLISYNVNTLITGALSDANIYYPRFIRIIEVNE